MGTDINLSVKIGAKTFPNPVGAASGTFGYGREYEELLDISAIGAIFTKAVTLEPRGGNAPPRLIETPSGILNSIGLANVGVDKFISEKLPYLKTLPCAVVANVAGSTEDEYQRVIEKLESVDNNVANKNILDNKTGDKRTLDKNIVNKNAAESNDGAGKSKCVDNAAVNKNILDNKNDDKRTLDKNIVNHDDAKNDIDGGIWGYEINVSCPNVKHGGLAFGTDPAQIERLTASLRKLTAKPLIIKLTPNVTDITVIARAAEAGGADAVSLINTLVGMVIDVKEKRPALGTLTGGLSGPAVRPVGVALTYKTSRAVNIPVIGMGGITNAEDALQYLLAGAAAIQIGTANFVNPQTPREILDGIRAYCEEQGISDVNDLRGIMD